MASLDGLSSLNDRPSPRFDRILHKKKILNNITKNDQWHLRAHLFLTVTWRCCLKKMKSNSACKSSIGHILIHNMRQLILFCNHWPNKNIPMLEGSQIFFRPSRIQRNTLGLAQAHIFPSIFLKMSAWLDLHNLLLEVKNCRPNYSCLMMAYHQIVRHCWLLANPVYMQGPDFKCIPYVGCTMREWQLFHLTWNAPRITLSKDYIYDWRSNPNESGMSGADLMHVLTTKGSLWAAIMILG